MMLGAGAIRRGGIQECGKYQAAPPAPARNLIFSSPKMESLGHNLAQVAEIAAGEERGAT